MDKNKNHVEEEDDLSFFDKLNEIEGDGIFSKFMNQSPVDFSELEQYTDDEMSAILKQEMDDSVIEHAPRTSPTPSTMELPADVKKPRKKQSRSALEELTTPTLRRSKRIKLKRASATKSENMIWLEEYISEEKARFKRAQRRARAAELAALKAETKNLSNENTDSMELHETTVNQMHQQYAWNDDVKLGIPWLEMIASNLTTAGIPLSSNTGKYEELLPNLQGYERIAEAPPGFTGASTSAAGGNDAPPRCTADDDHSPNDSSGNNGLAESSGKSADLAPTN